MNTTPITDEIDTDDSDAHALTCVCDECVINRLLDAIEDRAA